MSNKFVPEEERSTAYYIFHNHAQIAYRVDYASFRLRNKLSNTPLMDGGSARDLVALSNEMIDTRGTIFEIATLYNDGAQISFKDPNKYAEVYTRIIDHLRAHANAAISDLTYRSPPKEDFEILSKFATAIFSKARITKPDIDNATAKSSFVNNRPSITFERHKPKEMPVESEPAPQVIPRSESLLEELDRIEEIIRVKRR